MFSRMHLQATTQMQQVTSDRILSSKMMATRSGLASQRAALGEIGNKVSKITLDPTKKTVIKNGWVDPVTNKQKTLSKSKATTSLKVLAEEDTFKKPEIDNAKLAKTHSVPSTHSVVPVLGPMDMSEDKPEVFDLVLKDIEDIDANDGDNPQLVSDYVNDIYEYMRMLERKHSVQLNYLAGQEITGKMRSILIDWLCQVHHRFHLLQETLYLTVSIIDRFLQVRPVSRGKLQLVGVTAMLVASKYEEMYAPEVADFVYITDNAYTKADIRHMECIILKTLDFSLGKPLCLHFLRRNSKAGQVDANKHTLAKYLMELTITEYDMVHVHPSQIAAAALCISIRLLDGSSWSDTLCHYSTYSEKELLPVIYKLASLVVKSETSKLTAVRCKYQSSKFSKISLISQLKSSTIKELASLAS